MSAPGMKLAPASRAEFSAKWSNAICALILFVAGVWAALNAYSKPFWYDEVCTITVCRLADSSTIWNALSEGIDGNPPAYYLAARLARQIVPEDHLGYRVLSILGLLLTGGCLYAFLSRRVDRLAAIVALTFMLATVLSSYSYEARPYALLCGLLSAAMLAWQRLDDSNRYAVLLAVVLAAAVSVHYYAIFALSAFIGAEGTVLLLERRFRVRAWGAFLLAITPLLAVAGIMMKMRATFSKHFWAAPSYGQVLTATDWLMNLGSYWGWTYVLMVSGVFGYWARTKLRPIGAGAQRRYEIRIGEKSSLPVGECVLVAFLLWLPVISVIAAKVLSGGMTDRYMMPMLLGASAAAGLLASNLPQPVQMLLIGVLFFKFGLSTVGETRRMIQGGLLHSRNAAAGELHEILRHVPPSNLPVVVSSGLRYFPLAEYTPSATRTRLYTLVDPALAVKYSFTDSVDLGLTVLSRYADLNTEDYKSFTAKHTKFLVISEPDNQFDWLMPLLVSEGHELRLLHRKGRSLVYEVTLRS